MIFYVERGRFGDIETSLRVLDLSRQSQTWGTELPVVAESDAIVGHTNLIDIPVGQEFRSLLRVYDFLNSHAIPNAPVNHVLVRLYRVSGATEAGSAGDEFLMERLLEFRDGGFFFPGFAQLSLSDLAPVAGATHLRVEIVPASPNLRYWAFVSVTNNATQHVTTITPR